MFKFERDSMANVIFISIVLCLACSLMVSAAVATLKPTQQLSKDLDRKVNILRAAGAYDGPTELAAVDKAFEQFTAVVIDLKTGEAIDGVDPLTFDQLKSSKDPAFSRVLTDEEDIATLKRLEGRAVVYAQRNAAGAIEKLVLPVRGYGLWGTLYGYLALDGDLNTIAGLGFYKQQETPGLGGEVDNPNWKAKWIGVKLFDAEGKPSVDLVKVRAPAGSERASHEVDALSGATITTQGVENMIRFWAGDLGYGPYLRRLRNQAQAT